jgi:hypothetical protein
MINQKAIRWDNLESIDTIIDQVKAYKNSNTSFEFFI